MCCRWQLSSRGFAVQANREINVEINNNQSSEPSIGDHVFYSIYLRPFRWGKIVDIDIEQNFYVEDLDGYEGGWLPRSMYTFQQILKIGIDSDAVA